MNIISQVFHDKFYLSLENQLLICVLGPFFVCLVLGELTLCLHIDSNFFFRVYFLHLCNLVSDSSTKFPCSAFCF